MGRDVIAVRAAGAAPSNAETADAARAARDAAATVRPNVYLLSARRTMVDLLAGALNIVGSCDTPSGELHDAVRRDAILVVDGALDADDRAIAACIARCRTGNAGVLVVFCEDDPLVAAKWVELGASGVTTQQTSLSEIEDMLGRLSRRETVLGVSVREGLLSILRKSRQQDADRHAMFSALTKREAQVLRELANGTSPDDVARLSFVSLNTVRTQIRGVLAKLGVGSVVSAVALAYRTGWIPADCGTHDLNRSA